ncbi:hypothetical protein HYPSUDRAFT_45729 [Hypholoma sublateritium FD-334 SS-4]|uniref:DUF6532 domain-containing protein n=1 Tax=Hypholoma sublateritium (strain FD-334 SS-4) TaxID=945553 RepID=A0A0D2NMQ1_HYPSF|nr:hypothetical protein HYPSUDRAFT_45729 [Hypholoma sublateritium FD-334 SS-4]
MVLQTRHTAAAAANVSNGGKKTTRGQKSPPKDSSESPAKNLKRKSVQKAITGRPTSATTNNTSSGKPASGEMSLEDKMSIYNEIQKKIASQKRNAQDVNNAEIAAKNQRLLEEELEDEEQGEEEDDDDLEESPPRKKYRSQTMVLDEEETALAQSLPDIPAREASPSVDDDQDDEEELQGGGENDSDARDADIDNEEEHEKEDDSMDGSFLDNGLVIEDVDNSRSTVSIKSRRSLSKTPSVKSTFTGKSSQVQDAPKSSSGKVTEAHFPSHATRLLAIASKAQVRHNMIFKNIHDATGPKRMEFAWEAIKDAAKRGSNSGIETAFQRASTDVPLKKMLITFALYARTNLLSTLISHTRSLVKGTYNLSGSVADVRSSVVWLLEDAKFMYGGIDIQKRIFDSTKPFGSRFMIEVIEYMWFNSSSKSKADQHTTSQILKDKHLPPSILMLTLTAIEHSLKEWKDGVKVQLPFSDDTVKSLFSRHMANWRRLEASTTKWAKYWLKEIFKQLMTSSNFTLKTSLDTTKDLATVNFTALDEIAGMLEDDEPQD